MTAWPSHLYHYTSIQNLALILSTKTIRFRKLSLFNDLDEGAASDLVGIEAHVYGSCWTASPVESLPLWKLYAGEMKGCRIQLPVNPFDGDLVSVRSFKGSTENCVKLRKPVLYSPGELEGDLARHSEILGPTKILYSDDPKVLAPSVVTDTGTSAKFDAWNIGLAKKKHWRFEEEWRYRIHLRPEGTESVHTVERDALGAFVDIQWYPPLNDSIDVPIREEALDDLQITLAPLAGDAELVIAEALAPDSTPIDKSAIPVRIR